MQFKSITVIAVLLLLVASLSVTGCTTSVTNPTTSPESTSVDMTTKLNNAFTARDFVIVSPFTKATNQFKSVVYTGVVKDGEKTLTQYVYNFTIEEANGRNQSISRFNTYVSQALKQGYPQSTGNQTGIFYGQLGSVFPPAKSVGISINEPDRGLTWPYPSGGNGVSASNPNYTVVVVYMTKA
jgi:hypothetical protein